MASLPTDCVGCMTLRIELREAKAEVARARSTEEFAIHQGDVHRKERDELHDELAASKAEVERLRGIAAELVGEETEWQEHGAPDPLVVLHERDEARAELARMRPVVEAAVEWYCRERIDAGANEDGELCCEVIVAIDAYRKETP